MPADPAKPGRIGRYVDLALLGRGGMGAVYRGRDPELDRPVAIKVMLDATPDFVARFRREAQSIARLTHPNIVQIYDFGVDVDNNPYFVMELIDGTPLDKLVRARGRLMPADAVRVIRQAAEGLAAAHRAGIVHRDVKPSNLIVDGRGAVKLVDFGIARAGAAALMGTPGYMAPEQASGKPVDHRADIYALGLTLFEVLAGEPPFKASDPITLVIKNMKEPLPNLRAHGLDIPEELVRLIEQMGAKDPAERLQSCTAVAAALSDVESRLPKETPPRHDTPALDDTPPATPRRRAEELAEVPPTKVHKRRAAPEPVAPRPSTAAEAPTGAPGRSPLVWAAALVVLLVGGAALGWRLLQRGKNGGAVLQNTQQSGAALDAVPAAQQPPLLHPDQQSAGSGAIAKQSSSGSPNARQLANAAVQHQTGGPLRVAVLRFQNVSSDQSLAALRDGIGETVVAGMGNFPGVTLIERNDIDSDIGEIDRGGDFHFDAATVARLGQLKGVEVAVQGGFQRAGGKLRLTARFVRVENGEILESATVTRAASDVLGAQDELARLLRQKLPAVVAAERR
jgi:serine/threonine-protein kinase